MDIIQAIEKEIAPVIRTINFDIGDTVKVHYRIVEGDRERIQIFEGIAIAINNKGNNKTFTIRKISFDVGVERTFPLFSPRIAELEVVRKGKVRRAKLNFLKKRKGKSAKLKERRMKTPLKASKKNSAENKVQKTDSIPDEAAQEKTEENIE